MKKINRQTLTLSILSFFLFLCPFVVNAASASTSFSGNGTVYVGNNIEVVLSVNTDTPIVAFQGNLNYDSSKLELVSQNSLAPYEVAVNGNKIGGMDMTGNLSINGSRNIIKLTFKAKELGSANISFSGNKQVGADNVTVSSTGCSKTINITNPPSSNNNLSSLSVSVGNINFNKNTTSYNLSVDSNVTNVTINANTEDGGSRIRGTGNKSLNYGNNKIDIIVTAPSGAEKTYTININRKDIRSSNNNLSSLKVNGGELSPKFNKNTTKYSVSVPYSVSDLNVNATPEDNKAKVSISGNKGLIAEETKDVTITVTAENGSKKTYTISVSRGKDPNKKLSNNNYLSHLNVSVGLLSPVFNKETTNYEVWLPYEIDKINFDYGVEDTRYATTKFEGNDTLQPGVANIYKIIVKAESEETRTYTISVKRAKNPSENNSSNTNLKSIKLKNASLLEIFDKDKHDYYYTRKKGFEIKEVVPEDENSAVSTYEDGNTIYIIVISSSGEYGVYTLREKEASSYLVYLIAIITFIIGLVLGFILSKVIKNRKQNEKITKSKDRKKKQVEDKE